jgi:hypothetical protein
MHSLRYRYPLGSRARSDQVEAPSSISLNCEVRFHHFMIVLLGDAESHVTGQSAPVEPPAGSKAREEKGEVSDFIKVGQIRGK